MKTKCKHCDTRLIWKQGKPKLSKKTYFSQYLFCPTCKKVYLNEKYRCAVNATPLPFEIPKLERKRIVQTDSNRKFRKWIMDFYRKVPAHKKADFEADVENVVEIWEETLNENH